MDGVEQRNDVRGADGQDADVSEQEVGPGETRGGIERSGSGLQSNTNAHSTNPPQNTHQNLSKKSGPNPTQRRAQARRRNARRDPSLAPPLLHIPSEEETRAADARTLMRLMARSIGKEV